MSTVATPQAATSSWNIDPVHSVAEFKVKHMMISNVKGQFTTLKGALVRGETDSTKSHVQASIEAASITTRDAQRDTHLKSADFLDVGKFPVLSFKSTRISRSDDGALTVAGDLALHGITRMGLSATTKINRKDFGLNWNTALETGGILVGEEVTITLDVQFVKA
jgi:polyisoprenoid-binding protein YceI